MGLAGKYSVLLLGLLLALTAQADKLRCEGKIIEPGMSQDEVLKYCGQPDATDNQVRISWTYNNREGGVNVVVYFYANGDVEAIESVRD
jgi:hypothetical protein